MFGPFNVPHVCHTLFHSHVVSTSAHRFVADPLRSELEPGAEVEPDLGAFIRCYCWVIVALRKKSFRKCRTMHAHDLVQSNEFSHRVDVIKCHPKTFSVFEEGDFAPWKRCQCLGGLLDAVFLLEVEVRLELDQGLVLQLRSNVSLDVLMAYYVL